MHPMILLIIIVVFCLGGLASLLSSARSLVGFLRQIRHGIPFLTPVSVFSHDGHRVTRFFGLLQVRHLAEQMPETSQEDAEEV